MSCNFWPPLNQKGPLWQKIGKIVQSLIVIAQNKGCDALNATQKIETLYKVTFKKNKEILHKIGLYITK